MLDFGFAKAASVDGSQPRWRRDGRELFYVAPDERLMAVPVAMGADGQLETGAPVPPIAVVLNWDAALKQ